MRAASAYIQSRRLGAMTVTAINDGSITLPVELNVPREVWEREIRTDGAGRVRADSHVLLVRAGSATILIDAGLDDPGSEWDQRFLEEWPGAVRTPGVAAGLAALGVRAQDVTHVLVTHAHFDHVLGLAVQRDGRLVPRYPNARVLIGRADWETASEQHLGPEQRRRIGAVAEAGLLELFDSEREVLQGVTMIPAPGESPGHSLIQITSGQETLYAIGDLFHYPAEVAHPDWMVPWAEHQQMRASRERLLADAVASSALIVFTHETFPPWGRIVRTEHGGFRWQRV
ncbi:MAG TPA: MBL fold metallo-hydrolase [Solirubrobacteraceae bacterium]|nr:MBL fold metallo-hydrolase [Solirubrobacteraceae bacterium]